MCKTCDAVTLKLEGKHQLEHLIELLNDQRGDIYSGTDRPYGDSRQEELDAIDRLLTVLTAAR